MIPVGPDTPRSRFAPTPSGYLHLGNVFNLLRVERWRDETGGRMLLRIDDLDRARVRVEYVEDIFRVADWLGVRFDDGPASPDELTSAWSQSLRAPRYDVALAPLVNAQRVFACPCSRHDLSLTSTDGRYPCTCRSAGHPLDLPDAAWRLRLEPDDVLGPPDPGFRDPVVRRKDGTVAYHVASIVDDVDYGITHVIRGVDLEPSSRLQYVLARRMGLDAFAAVEMVHHALVTAAGGGKLSKSAGARSRSLLTDPGLTPGHVRRAFDTWAAAQPPER